MEVLVTCVVFLISMATALVYPLCHPSCQSSSTCGKGMIIIVTFFLILHCGTAYSENRLRSNCAEGTILPREPMFVQGQNLTLICNAKTIRSKHLKFIRGPDREQLPDKYVQKINRTTIKLEFPVTEAEILSHSTSMQYRCIKRRKNKKDTCIDNVYVQLDYKPEPPTNVTCRLYDFLSISCTWELGVTYIHKIDVDCQYVTEYYDHGDLMYKSDNDAASWQACPKQVGNSCIWENNYFTDPLVLYIKLEVSNSQNKVASSTEILKFNKYDIIVPGPVENLFIQKIKNSRCVTVDWTPSAAGSGRDYVFDMTYQSDCSEPKSRKVIYNGIIDTLVPVHVCDLNPYTVYTFTVSGRILAPKQFDNETIIEKGLWSPIVNRSIRTDNDVIDVNPSTSPGLYEIDSEKSMDREGYATLRMYWTPLSECDQHSSHKSIYYTIYAYNISKKATYEKFYDQINIPQNHGMINITIQARNEVGGPNITDSITVFPTTYAPEPSELIVKFNDTNSNCMMFAVINVRETDPVQHTVVWCKGTLFCQEPIKWQILDTNQTKYQFPQDVCENTISYRFGLVTHSYHDDLGIISNTGIHWAKCAYQIAKVPTEPLPYVDVIPGPVLDVRWSEYDCNEIRVYITEYNISYCKTSSHESDGCQCSGPLTSKVVNRSSFKYTDDSLPNDTKVCVWVTPVTFSGPVLNIKPLLGIISDRKDADYKGSEILTIVLSIFGSIVFIGCLILIGFCIRKRWKKVKKENNVRLDLLYENAPIYQHEATYAEESSDTTPMNQPISDTTPMNQPISDTTPMIQQSCDTTPMIQQSCDTTLMIQQTSNSTSDMSSGVHTQSSYIDSGDLWCNSEPIELTGYTETHKLLSLSSNDFAECSETESETEEESVTIGLDIKDESVSENSQCDNFSDEIDTETDPVESHNDTEVITKAPNHLQDYQQDELFELQEEYSNETPNDTDVCESDAETDCESTSALFHDTSKDLSGYDHPSKLEIDTTGGLDSCYVEESDDPSKLEIDTAGGLDSCDVEESDDPDKENEAPDVDTNVITNTGKVSDDNSSESIDDYHKYATDSTEHFRKQTNGLNGFKNGFKKLNGFSKHESELLDHSKPNLEILMNNPNI